LSRKYSVPVNDLAVMNKLTPPFSLSVGQQLRVPKISGVANEKQTIPATVKISKTNTKNISATVGAKKSDTVVTQKQVVAKPKKISSDPSKKLPTITARSSSKFSWPVRGKILSAYGAKSNGLFNDGINISAKRGTAVKAAENGVVAYAGNEVKGMGNLIIIQHAGGWMTVYAHMDSMNVKRGTRVNVGQKIGAVGETGKVDSPQLHFEIRKGTKAYNPNTYLK
jgi:murein DD-endopeptidase MepM/ murein hydrolase activator NlpD